MKPKILNLIQGSQEWIDLRSKMITATNIAPLMGLSPWKTALALWEEKLGLREPEKTNEKMEEGSRLEVVARDYFNKTYETDFQPAVLQHAKIEYLMASLDGLNSKNEILEIKCGQGSHDLAKKGDVPAYYLSQLQCQMFCADVKQAFYFSYRDDDDNILLIINRDDVFIEKMLVESEKFYKMMLNFTPPAETSKDFVKRDSKELRFYVEIWKQNKEELKRLEAKDELLRQTIIEMCENQSSECDGVRIAKQTRRGNINYARIEILKSIDLEKYRSKSTISFRFTEIK